MNELISCVFNIDSGCVELKYADRTMISIDCTAVERSIDTTMYSRTEMDWLIYNDPISYAQLILGGTMEDYLKRVSGKHSIELDTAM